MAEGDPERLHIVVDGRVQGVGFRYYVVDQAIDLDVAGWVRNRWDGTVEVVAEGRREDLEQLLWLVRRGPRGAYVSDAHFEWLPYAGEFLGFRVRPTD